MKNEEYTKFVEKIMEKVTDRPKEMTTEYWEDLILSQGFLLVEKHHEWHVYLRDNFQIRFNSEHVLRGLAPAFEIQYKRITAQVRLATPCCMPVTLRNVVDYREFLFVLDALSSPERAPLCVGIDWMEEILSAFLTNVEEECETL